MPELNDELAIFSAADLSASGAKSLDEKDPLRSFREAFHIPIAEDGSEVVYLTGNSLGLQPKATRMAVLEVLDDWAALGVEGHFKAKHAWMPYHALLTEQMASVVGAASSEVVVMNSLTVNIHLLMASFYRPEGRKSKIVIEANAFPSDRYAVRSHLEWHGLDPEEHLIIAGNASGAEAVLQEEDIEAILKAHAGEVALVMMGGVNYYSGQLFDMQRITRAAHAAGSLVGFDLAHAAGNVELKLHDWNVDFAAWCSYKYLNAGPGGPSGVFVHTRHGSNPNVLRLSGWWGHDAASRFKMPDTFIPSSGAEGWQLSNPSILSMAAFKASLDVFEKVGMEALIQKSRKLTAYTAALLEKHCGERVELITPSDPTRRGAQLSVRIRPETGASNAPPPSYSIAANRSGATSPGKMVFNRLEAAGVICDWREPDVIRLAPVPLYNSFQDAFLFAERLKQALNPSSLGSRI